MEEHELRVKENLNRTVHFALADSLHNIQRDQKDDHAKFDVLCSNNIKGMANVFWRRLEAESK